MSLQELQHNIGGHLHGPDVAFNAVSIDTRTLKENDLFIAIKGKNFNGNQFVAEAARKRAIAAIVSEQTSEVLPVLQVEDCRLALGQLGALNRAASEACVIALTGSQGKTTVKEMLATILSECGEVLYTKGNLNNDYGVPLTLLNLDQKHKYAVIELGASAAGEIAYTSGLTRPKLAHITNVAPTHLEGFGDLEGVAKAKGEIWDSISEDGKAIINIDDDFAPSWLEANKHRTVIKVSARGSNEADYLVSDIRFSDKPGATFKLHTPGNVLEISLQLTGKHNVANALAAAALAMEAGASSDNIKVGLEKVVPVPGRLFFRKGYRDAVVIDDSYNASPSSFKAAIDVLSVQAGLKLLAVGDMGELADETEKAHKYVGQYAKEKNIDHVFTIGRFSHLATESFGSKAEHFSDFESMALKIRELLDHDVSIVVKGSRSAGMDKLVQLLISKGA